MKPDTTIDYINTIDKTIVQGVGYKPERHTGINPNWDCIFIAIIPLSLLDVISKLEYSQKLENNNSTIYSITGWILAIFLMVCGIFLTLPYMKIRDRIFPPKSFIVYIGINNKKKSDTRKRN